MLTARNSKTFVRAASGLIDKNSESARATAIAVSPAVINECTRDSRWKGVVGGSPVPTTSRVLRVLATRRYYAVRCLSYLYPKPRMVMMRVGLAGSSSIFERSRLM